MIIDDLPDAPDPAIDPPSIFSIKAAKMVLSFKTMVVQIRAAIASLSVLAAGGAYAIPYTVDLSSTADADPTAGKLRFNATTQNAATTIYLDLLGSDGADYTSILDQFDASTSVVKGQIRIVKQGDPTKFLTFDVTARTTATGYRKLSLTNTGGSSQNPFVPGDAVLIKFTRTGDKGVKGDPGTNGTSGDNVLLASYSVSGAVTQIDFLNLFSDAYSEYVVKVDGMSTSSIAGASDVLLMRVAIGGAVDTSSVYVNPVPDGGSLNTAATQALGFGYAITSATQDFTMSVVIRNARSTTRHKGFGLQGRAADTAVIKEARYQGTSALSGFRLFFSAGSTINGGNVRVYGIRAA